MKSRTSSTAAASTVLKVIAGAAFTALGITGVSAQTFKSIQPAEQPLVLKSRGSFYVGGEQVEQTKLELGGRNPDDRITVNQMYVEFMVPVNAKKVPIVLIHGATLSGKSYDTTPDGRMGWFEYFVRQGHPAYVVDQVGRARSGFNQAALNRNTESPRKDAPRPHRFGDRAGVWTNFRFGPRFGETFPDAKFPVAAVGELAKQSIPDMSDLVPTPNPTHRALAELAKEVSGAVLISHSQSGHFPMEAALIDPTGVRGIVAVEPGRCRSADYSEAQIAQLAKVPTLVIYGDFLPVPTGYSEITWQDRYVDCTAYVERVNKAGGHARIVRTPELGFKGNSHMLMHDSNNLQVADFMRSWIESMKLNNEATQPK